MMRVVDTVTVGADDADAFRLGDRLQFALACFAAGVEAFGVSGGPNDRGFQSGAGAVADGLDRGLGGDGEEGDIDRLGDRGQVGETGNAVDLFQAAADAVDAAFEPGVADVVQHDIAKFGVVAGGADHRHRARMKQGVERVFGGGHGVGSGQVWSCLARRPMVGQQSRTTDHDRRHFVA